MKIILKNLENLSINDGSTDVRILAIFPTVYDMDGFREKLTSENLSEFQFATNSGDVVGNYKNYELSHVEYRYINGEYEATFYLEKISDTELRIRSLESGQEVQDGAIEELAEMAGGE